MSIPEFYQSDNKIFKLTLAVLLSCLIILLLCAYILRPSTNEKTTEDCVLANIAKANTDQAANLIFEACKNLHKK